MSEEIEYPALYLKRGEDARLRAGHLWVYSNEVDVARSPLTAFEPGEACAIAMAVVTAGRSWTFGGTCGPFAVGPTSTTRSITCWRGLTSASPTATPSTKSTTPRT